MNILIALMGIIIPGKIAVTHEIVSLSIVLTCTQCYFTRIFLPCSDTMNTGAMPERISGFIFK